MSVEASAARVHRLGPPDPFGADRRAPLILALLLTFVLLAFAERTLFGGPGAYDVSAERSEISSQADTVVLTGKVEVTQNARRFRSPRVVITYEHPDAGRNGGPVSRSIRHLEADGPAYFVTPDRTVRGDHATYDAATGDIVVTGDVVVTQGRNVSTGGRLVINEAAGTTIMSAAPGGRVRSVIYPQ